MYTTTKRLTCLRWLYITVLLLCFTGVLQAQQSTLVTGTVRDASGSTLPGVNVSIKGTSNATITDYDGKFSIQVKSPKSILAFSYVGFTTVETLVGSNRTLNIVLKENVTALDEVVVMAYGSKKKQTVTGSVSMLRSNELLETPVANMSNALTGKLPGVITIQGSGRPGEDVAKIYIRGQSSWVDSSPLIIIDGIEQESFAQLDPNEIETLSVLKDASSTAVYGIRGANGVILITTKRGAEGKPQISLSANFGIQRATRVPKFLGSYEHLLLRKQAWINDGKDPVIQEPTLLSDESLEGFRLGTDPYRYPDVDWYDEIVGKSVSPQQQYNVNVSGGTKVVKYFVSLGYLNQEGRFNYQDRQKEYDPTSYYKRFNFRSNIDLTVNKYQRVSASISGRSEELNGIQGVGGAVGGVGGFYQGLIALEPWRIPLFNPDGSLAGLPTTGSPIRSVAHSGYDNKKANYFDIIGTLSNDLSFLTKGLSLDLSISYNNMYGATNKYREGYPTYYYDPVRDTYEQMGELQPFNFSEVKNLEPISRTQFQAKIGYNREFGLHAVNAILVYNQQAFVTGKNIPSAMMGYAARVEYGFANKYLAEASLGYNGSENFAKGHQFGLFPSGSVGYVISEEEFMSGARKVIPYLKLKASIGLVGNDRGQDRFLYMGEYGTVGNYTGGGTPSFGFGTNNPSTNGGIIEKRNENKLLTWETALKKNFGIEGRFFRDNLFSYTVEVFQDHRKDILMKGRSTSQIVGLSAPYMNVGEVKNHGYEIEVNHRNKVREVEYYIRGNYCFSRNKILNYDDPAGAPYNERVAGYRIDQYKGYQVLGYFQDATDIKNSPDHTTLGGVIVPGDFKYRDTDGNGILNEKDKVAMGYSRIPEITYSFTPGIAWKGFEISAMFQGVAHVSVYYAGNSGFEFGGGAGGGQVMEMHKNYWTPENEHTKPYPSLHIGSTHSNKNINSYHLKSGNFIRLKNLQLSYSFPKSICKKLYMSNLKVYLNGNNLYTWTKLDNFDPEVMNQSGDTYPQQSVYNIGVNINF